MINFDKFTDEAWDRLLEFLDDSCELNQEQVRDELRRLGIDVASAARRVLHMVRSSEAREALARARLERPKVLAQFAQRVTQAAGVAREELRALIKVKFSGPLQAAYFHRLESASDADLLSLLQDLDALSASSDDTDGTG